MSWNTMERDGRTDSKSIFQQGFLYLLISIVQYSLGLYTP